ncbi:MAG: DUF1320 family protein [Acidobacterium ailaaui]|nr:DUF1320 family protein [Pseudacidobacterium ailaaui]
MAYLTPDELKTHIYDEAASIISRGDETLLQTAIDEAIAEAKAYLTAYDTETIFTASGSERNPILLLYVKDIAIWHFLAVCNAGVELALREDRYNKAISFLQGVQSGKINPDLPLKQSTTSDVYIKFGTIIPPRNNYF